MVKSSQKWCSVNNKGNTGRAGLHRLVIASRINLHELLIFYFTEKNPFRFGRRGEVYCTSHRLPNYKLCMEDHASE